MTDFINRDQLRKRLNFNLERWEDSALEYEEDKSGVVAMKEAIHELDMIPTADVVPKSEVERLEKKIQRLTNSMIAYGLGMVQQKEQNYELAKEIFEEIESDIEELVQDARNCQEEYQSPAAKSFITLCEGKLSGLGEAKQVISQLKKKYTEGEPNG